MQEPPQFPPDRSPTPYPNILHAFALFAVFVVANFIGGSFLLAVGKDHQDIGFLVAYVVSMGGTYLFARYFKKMMEGEVTHRFNTGPIAMYPLLILATWALVIFVTPVIELLPSPDWLEEMMEGAVDTTSVWSFLSVVVAAPILEELLFRGIILDGHLKLYPSQAAIGWSAFYFGFFHMNPWQFLLAFALGVLLGWVYFRTGSLLPCILIHAVNNGVSFFASGFLDESQKSQELSEMVGGAWPTMGMMLGALAVLWLCVQGVSYILRKKED